MLQLQNEEVEKCLASSSVDLPGQVLPSLSSSRQALSSARQNACVTHDAWFWYCSAEIREHENIQDMITFLNMLKCEYSSLDGKLLGFDVYDIEIEI